MSTKDEMNTRDEMLRHLEEAMEVVTKYERGRSTTEMVNFSLSLIGSLSHTLQANICETQIAALQVNIIQVIVNTFENQAPERTYFTELKRGDSSPK